MFGYLRWLELEVNAMKAPDGSRAYPGKTCRDIRMCLPDVTSGTYLVFLPRFVKAWPNDQAFLPTFFQHSSNILPTIVG